MSNGFSRSSICAACLILSVAGSAYATILNDGMVHTIAKANEQYVLQNHTTLNVVTGAKVLSNRYDASGIRVESGSVVNLSDGLVQGPDNYMYSTVLPAINLIQGIVNVNGGTVLGGRGWSYPFSISGPAMRMTGGTLTIDGGAIVGGTIYQGSGIAGDGLIVTGGTLTMLNGLIRGGSAQSPYSGYGRGLLIMGDAHATIRGGSIGQGIPDGSKFSVGMDGTSILHITGGRFFGHFTIGGSSQLHVYGENLKYDGVSLTGKLQSGQSISQEITISNNAQVILHNIPEPTAVVLWASGILILLAAFGRRPRR